ncbi:hypothetical protein HY494_01170 [Candidatus Woesearchaeota archaeon]|nr:hypothetical protein [Candidatus Woesearchaeota archaeon]
MKLPESLYAYFQEAKQPLEHTRDEIELIENIAKNQVKESLKPSTYRRASLDHDLKTAHETLEEAKAELTEIIKYLHKELKLYSLYLLYARKNSGWRNRKKELVTDTYYDHWAKSKKGNKTLAEFNRRISYLETLEKSIIYLIGLEKKAKEQS